MKEHRKNNEPSLIQKLLSEIVGTFMITLTAMGVDIPYFSTHTVDYVSRWLARGFITAAVVYAFSETSGAHVNPAVTIGFWASRVFPWRMTIAYLAAEFAGAFAAAGLIVWCYGPLMVLGASRPGPSVTTLQAVLAEVVLTFIVVLTILMTATENAVVGKDTALAVGFSVAACGFFGGPISGASMNPARSIAPQLLAGRFDLVPIYAFAPLAGALAAAAAHYLICGRSGRTERKAAQGK